MGDIDDNGYNVFVTADVSERQRVVRSDVSDIAYDQYRYLNNRYATPYGNNVSAFPAFYRESAPGSKNFAVNRSNMASRLIVNTNCDASRLLTGAANMGSRRHQRVPGPPVLQLRHQPVPRRRLALKQGCEHHVARRAQAGRRHEGVRRSGLHAQRATTPVRRSRSARAPPPTLPVRPWSIRSRRSWKSAIRTIPSLNAPRSATASKTCAVAPVPSTTTRAW
ncbi:hypothetical protein LP419_09995 [Massilia sp. H-1]|nr:hypothetical protein LP419_09995 [Massilia sp. H-1]